jgi:hypothetical protein
MLHEIVLSVCLSATMASKAPVCKDVNMTAETEQAWENLLPQQCQLIGQQKAAEYINEHPGWIVTRYSCPPAKKKSQDI